MPRWRKKGLSGGWGVSTAAVLALVLQQATAESCGAITVSTPADLSATDNCSTADSLTLVWNVDDNTTLPIELPALTEVHGNLYIFALSSIPSVTLSGLRRVTGNLQISVLQTGVSVGSVALPQLERVFGSIQVGGPDTHVGTISTVTLGGSNESALRVDGTLVVGGAVLSHIGHLDIPYAKRIGVKAGEWNTRRALEVKTSGSIGTIDINTADDAPSLEIHGAVIVQAAASTGRLDELRIDRLIELASELMYLPAQGDAEGSLGPVVINDLTVQSTQPAKVCSGFGVTVGDTCQCWAHSPPLCTDPSASNTSPPRTVPGTPNPGNDHGASQGKSDGTGTALDAVPTVALYAAAGTLALLVLIAVLRYQRSRRRAKATRNATSAKTATGLASSTANGNASRRTPSNGALLWDDTNDPFAALAVATAQTGEGGRGTPTAWSGGSGGGRSRSSGSARSRDDMTGGSAAAAPAVPPRPSLGRPEQTREVLTNADGGINPLTPAIGDITRGPQLRAPRKKRRSKSIRYPARMHERQISLESVDETDESCCDDFDTEMLAHESSGRWDGGAMGRHGSTRRSPSRGSMRGPTRMSVAGGSHLRRGTSASDGDADTEDARSHDDDHLFHEDAHGLDTHELPLEESEEEYGHSVLSPIPAGAVSAHPVDLHPPSEERSHTLTPVAEHPSRQASRRGTHPTGRTLHSPQRVSSIKHHSPSRQGSVKPRRSSMPHTASQPLGAVQARAHRRSSLTHGTSASDPRRRGSMHATNHGGQIGGDRHQNPGGVAPDPPRRPSMQHYGSEPTLRSASPRRQPSMKHYDSAPQFDQQQQPTRRPSARFHENSGGTGVVNAEAQRRASIKHYGHSSSSATPLSPTRPPPVDMARHPSLKHAPMPLRQAVMDQERRRGEALDQLYREDGDNLYEVPGQVIAEAEAEAAVAGGRRAERRRSAQRTRRKEKETSRTTRAAPALAALHDESGSEWDVDEHISSPHTNPRDPKTRRGTAWIEFPDLSPPKQGQLDDDSDENPYLLPVQSTPRPSLHQSSRLVSVSTGGSSETDDMDSELLTAFAAAMGDDIDEVQSAASQPLLTMHQFGVLDEAVEEEDDEEDEEESGVESSAEVAVLKRTVRRKSQMLDVDL